MSSTDPEKISSMIYSGPYDLKYYLDRQSIESDSSLENANQHLKRNRVLVFVCYRKKKQTDITMCDVNVADKNEKDRVSLHKEAKVIQYYLGPTKNRVMNFKRCAITKAKFKPAVLDRYPRQDRPQFAFQSSIA